ncbi:DUF2255 family protein [Humibacter sp. RRB41]|uniref:DUF2255 family protein n=1 Tax=Humibacter sp. RRB41 TaxID=2919946 RepID=UPI001FAA86B0|nr:DUF2255 family protein [Humibacter sp. RRB41]
MTSRWSEAELRTIGENDEVVLASRGSDGSLSTSATIWIVRAGDDVFVRSAHGSTNRWYKRAVAAGGGHVAIGDVARDVAFEDASADADHAAIDAAYHAKYDGKYPKEYVDPVVDDLSHGATLRLIPA